MQSGLVLRKLQPLMRVIAAITVISLSAGLYVLGAQPLAVGLLMGPWDKLAHLTVFAGIGFGTGVAVGLRGWRMALSCLLGALLIGVIDEWHQMSLPGRTPSWTDLTADAGGGILGSMLLGASQRFFRPEA